MDVLINYSLVPFWVCGLLSILDPSPVISTDDSWYTGTKVVRFDKNENVSHVGPQANILEPTYSDHGLHLQMFAKWSILSMIVKTKSCILKVAVDWDAFME